MNLPEDVLREILSFINIHQVEIEHRFHKLCDAAKRLSIFSPKWLSRIGEIKKKIIKIFPEYSVLGKQLTLEKIEVDQTLQTFIMRVVHSDRFSRIERRMRQLQAMYIRKFYRSQETFSVLWDRRNKKYMPRVLTREEFDHHYWCIISHQMSDRMIDRDYKVSGCVNVSEEAIHSFGLTI